MILLDTDHVTVMGLPADRRHRLLSARIEATVNESFAITIVSAEELMRGWLAVIHGERDIHKQVPVYDRLAQLFAFVNRWTVVPFDTHSAEEFKRLRGARVRIGTQDLKIASVALANDALLLTANRRDFDRVPGLRTENWLE